MVSNIESLNEKRQKVLEQRRCFQKQQQLNKLKIAGISKPKSPLYPRGYN